MDQQTPVQTRQVCGVSCCPLSFFLSHCFSCWETRIDTVRNAGLDSKLLRKSTDDGETEQTLALYVANAPKVKSTLCEKMEKKISIQWHDPQGMGLWIRGIRPDGYFYGELEYAYGDPSRRAGTTVVGTIPPDRWAKCQELIARCAPPPASRNKQWVGQLAAWTNDFPTPDILLQYEPGDERDSDAARAFLELKAVMDDQLEEQAAELVEFSKKTHNKEPEATR